MEVANDGKHLCSNSFVGITEVHFVSVFEMLETGTSLSQALHPHKSIQSVEDRCRGSLFTRQLDENRKPGHDEYFHDAVVQSKYEGRIVLRVEARRLCGVWG